MMNTSTPKHIPVMLKTSYELLSPVLEKSGSVFLDCTLGLGGHTEYFLEHLPELQAIGIDRDSSAIEYSKSRLQKFSDRFTPHHAVYSELDNILELKHVHPNAILFDFGVSSMQLDDKERGFSYIKDAPLDMRMDQTCGETASDLIKRVSVEQLADIIRTNSGERYALQIAKKIKVNEPTTTGKLASIIRCALPKVARSNALSSIKRVFQAIRIEVNSEMMHITKALEKAIVALKVGGRILVLSFHSGEDIITKSIFKKGTQEFIDLEYKQLGFPFNPSNAKKGYLEIIANGNSASDHEILENSRAKSVRLRCAKKIRALDECEVL
ncbi:MAG: 16S rRNA (cytosine(1402)-N(4))-methyltransferase RsmH [Candidatus Ancillula sp.]|jgi:16S rRNA (cytosine1402-N4)-methyltransferase|nr:16S rRNA (cytosine(1402)-N(4))-methyltransferase RsmH [Candidatus Ancillula sp.]